MRKEDRVKAQQGQPQQHTDVKRPTDRDDREQVRGGGSIDQPQKPPRQPGRMPLPD
jgi:hypothetical protein